MSADTANIRNSTFESMNLNCELHADGLAIRSFVGRTVLFGAISKFEGCKGNMGEFRWPWLLWTSVDA